MKKLLVLFALLFVPIKADAYTLNQDDYVYVSGQSIGIKLETKVVVSGMYPVVDEGKTYRPWQNVLKENDIILSVNKQTIKTANDLKAMLSTNLDEYELEIQRKEIMLEVMIKPVKKSDGIISLGIYVKDHILGVGTLTYVIPDERIYGALGHNIKSNANNGEIYPSSVTSIKKSENGSVGEKQVKIEFSAFGDVKKNTPTGVHGILNYELDLPMYQIGLKEEVHKGKATLLTTIDGEKVEMFNINIIEVYSQKTKGVKSFKVEITDDDLVNRTGGIVQGMSGSPIIQDGKLIGALTHVVISDTTIGYGIYIQWMMEDMGIDIK